MRVSLLSAVVLGLWACSGTVASLVSAQCDWVEIQKLTASDAAAGDRFGSVSISGDVVVVGAVYDDNW